MVTAEERAKAIIERANNRLCVTCASPRQFATRECDAPVLHALVIAVADELVAMDERVLECEREIHRLRQRIL